MASRTTILHDRVDESTPATSDMNSTLVDGALRYGTSIVGRLMGHETTDNRQNIDFRTVDTNTCRDEIMSVTQYLAPNLGDTFTPIDVISEMHRRGSRYADSTIRTHITGLMCLNAPVNHATTYHDFERLDHGLYRIAVTAGSRALSVGDTAQSLPIEEDQLEEVPAGNSDVQRHAEAVALKILSEQYGFNLVPERLTLSNDVRVEIDGVSHDPPVLVEVWAHQGSPKSAQRNKVLADSLKLQFVNSALDIDYRMVFCFTDAAAAAPFLGRSWGSAAMRRAQVEIEIVELPDDLRAAIRAAQARQFR